MGSDPRSHLPADFYDQPPIVVMLARYDFKSFFMTVRRLTGWSQTTLGGVVGLNQSTISAVERGEHQLRNIDDVASLSRGLAIPPARLNFCDIRATVGAQGDTEREMVSWVNRRDFGEYAAKLVLGIAGAAGLDTDRIRALIPQAEPADNRQVGEADVTVIEQLTAAFRSQDFAHGSGVIRDAAAAQVNVALSLLAAQIPAELQPRLLLAAADLATQAGWMSFVVKDNEAARRLWVIALEIVREAEHPRSTDLTTYLLADMALQSVHLGRPTEAMHLIRIGHAAAVGRYPVSASTTSLLTNIEAQAHAAYGDAAGCERALGQAVEHFSRIDPTVAPPWTAYIGEVGTLGGGQGRAYYTLALPDRNARAAARAVPLLRQAVDRYGPGYARLRARYLPDLAGSHALAGDLAAAVSVGHEAIDAVGKVSDFVARDQLRTLHTVLEPLHTSPDVAELRHRLTSTTTAA